MFIDHRKDLGCVRQEMYPVVLAKSLLRERQQVLRTIERRHVEAPNLLAGKLAHQEELRPRNIPAMAHGLVPAEHESFLFVDLRDILRIPASFDPLLEDLLPDAVGTCSNKKDHPPVPHDAQGIVLSLIGLIEVDVPRMPAGGSDDHIGPITHRHAVLFVPQCTSGGMCCFGLAHNDPCHVSIAIENDIHDKYHLHQLCGFDHLVVHGVSVVDAGTAARMKELSVIGFDRFPSGDAGKDVLPSTGVASEVVNTNVSEGDHMIGLDDGAIQPDRRPTCTLPGENEILITVVNRHAKSPAEVAEHPFELFIRRLAVCSRCNQQHHLVPGDAGTHLLPQVLENLPGGNGSRVIGNHDDDRLARFDLADRIDRPERLLPCIIECVTQGDLGKAASGKDTGHTFLRDVDGKRAGSVGKAVPRHERVSSKTTILEPSWFHATILAPIGSNRYASSSEGRAMMQRILRTSESVTEGHPDKVADRVSDAVLDSILSDDTTARVACETFLTTGLVLVGGEITTSTYVEVTEIVRRVLEDIGYAQPGLGFHFEDCAVLSAIKEQSVDIKAAVDSSSDSDVADIGAGDQGIMFGYAKDDTDVLMPLPIVLAHRLTQRMSQIRKDGTLPYLRPDGKSQVTVQYEGERPIRVHTVLLAAQHAPDVSRETIEADLVEHVIKPVIGPWFDGDTKILINSSGRFVIGGPASDAGMTGRKIIVDTYGGFGSHGGGAFSGKDPTKVDRSGSYMARYVAKNLVAAGLARQVKIEVAYAIGRSTPLAVNVNSYGTGAVPDEVLVKAVQEVFDFRPGQIIDRFELRRPIYVPLSSYGHFGRVDLDLPWEKTDQIEALQRAAAQAG